MNCAPVILFAWKRPWHLKKTLDALAKNLLADQTALHIYIDGPKKNFSGEDHKNREAVIQIAEAEKRFAAVRVQMRTENLGLSVSVITGVNEILERSESIIVLEDDLVTSPFFLKFMNEGLNKYAGEEKVISLSAYMYPVKRKLPPCFFMRMADCWGWATWKEKWKLFHPDAAQLCNSIIENNKARDFDFNNTYPFTKMLQEHIEGKIDSWAIRWYASAFLNDKLSLYPAHSLVENIGNDGSGTHGANANPYFNTVKNEPVHIGDISIEENTVVRKAMADFFKSSFGKPGIARRILTKIKKL